jgi:hypothetical protein
MPRKKVPKPPPAALNSYPSLLDAMHGHQVNFTKLREAAKITDHRTLMKKLEAPRMLTLDHLVQIAEAMKIEAENPVAELVEFILTLSKTGEDDSPAA